MIRSIPRSERPGPGRPGLRCTNAYRARSRSCLESKLLGRFFISGSSNQFTHVEENTDVNEKVGEASQHKELPILPSGHSECDIWMRMTGNQDVGAAAAHDQCQQQCERKQNLQISYCLLHLR